MLVKAAKDPKTVVRRAVSRRLLDEKISFQFFKDEDKLSLISLAMSDPDFKVKILLNQYLT